MCINNSTERELYAEKHIKYRKIIPKGNCKTGYYNK